NTPNGSVTITSRGDFNADAVIVTLPLGVLQQDAVRFTPPLPLEKRDAIGRLGMGALSKIVLHFDQPFWPRDQYAFGYLCRAIDGFPTMVINLWKTHGIPALVVHAGGSLGRKLERDTIDDATAWAMTVVHDIFGASVPHPTSVQRTNWQDDPFSRGSYSYIAVGST